MVANVDTSDSRCRCIGKITARDLRLLASRLYRTAVTRPRSRAAVTATALSNVCRRDYALTVDAIKKQLLSRNTVSIALDGWTSTNKLAIMSVIAYSIDRNWALREVQLTFDEVDRLFFFNFES